MHPRIRRSSGFACPELHIRARNCGRSLHPPSIPGRRSLWHVSTTPKSKGIRAWRLASQRFKCIFSLKQYPWIVEAVVTFDFGPKVLVLAIAALGMSVSSSNAQSRWPNTQSVNECTQLQDPDQTRRCIEAYQGASTGSTSPAQQTSPLLLPTTPTAPASPPVGQAAPPRMAPR